MTWTLGGSFSGVHPEAEPLQALVSLHAAQSADPPLHHPLVRAVGSLLSQGWARARGDSWVGCLAQCSLHRGADRAGVPQARPPSLLPSAGVPESCLPLFVHPMGQCRVRVLAWAAVMNTRCLSASVASEGALLPLAGGLQVGLARPPVPTVASGQCPLGFCEQLQPVNLGGPVVMEHAVCL